MPTRSRAGHDDRDEVQAYLKRMPSAHRLVLDRIEGLIEQVCPEAALGISYGILCWKSAGRRLYIGSWQHGLSIYGWSQGGESAVTDRHPELKTSKGTIRLTSAAASDVTDDELRGLIRAALDD